MIKPIKPNEVQQSIVNTIPDEVIESFNEMIQKNFSGNKANFSQRKVLELIRKKMNSNGDMRDSDITHKIFENHWLDVEPIFEEVGWQVIYDKPSYYENYEPSFTFTRK